MAPECPHFGFCGGCSYQDIPYEVQVAEKSAVLEKMIGRAVEVVPSPVAYGYRNRMDFVCAFGRTGFRMRKRYKEVVDLTDCKLLPTRFLPLFLKLKAAIKEHGIETYDYLTHKGYLRYLIFRVAANTDGMLVSFVTASEDEKILPLIEIAAKEASSVHWLVHEGLADLSFGRIHRTFNEPFITEKIGDISFMIGPNTFFQNNGYLCSKLFDEAKQYVQGRVLDLFCGTGAISLYIASNADTVYGVELVDESIVLAKENARRNGIWNVSFSTADVGEWLKTQRGCRDYDTVVVDPPRIGLGGKICRRLCRMEMERIVYVSCNPATLRDDIQFLSEKFELVSIKGFDMFPQTPHVECVALLVKKKGID
ncbi:MAG: 23S rRNA (uracil(1939)-C(5))-methyltransferase RlmD [Fibrobacteres bacterium]|nr:23S rRNA (uracil(1939)-C(5))-methyltransferase RlmD [Fibrobacterota bacterium]